MPSNTPGYMQMYKNRLRQQLLAHFGYRCNLCDGFKCRNINLEFAHLRKTDLSGEGRGSMDRLEDIRNNITAYTLLGRACHKEYDSNV